MYGRPGITILPFLKKFCPRNFNNQINIDILWVPVPGDVTFYWIIHHLNLTMQITLLLNFYGIVTWYHLSFWISMLSLSVANLNIVNWLTPPVQLNRNFEIHSNDIILQKFKSLINFTLGCLNGNFNSISSIAKSSNSALITILKSQCNGEIKLIILLFPRYFLAFYHLLTLDYNLSMILKCNNKTHYITSRDIYTFIP